MQGDLSFISVTPACVANGAAAPGDFARSVYRPRLTSGGAAEGLAMFFSRSALIFEATGKSLRGNAQATETSIGSHSGTGEQATTVTLAISPARISATTPVVQISGTLRNIFETSGCNVTVVGALGLRHD